MESCDLKFLAAYFACAFLICSSIHLLYSYNYKTVVSILKQAWTNLQILGSELSYKVKTDKQVLMNPMSYCMTV